MNLQELKDAIYSTSGLEVLSVHDIVTAVNNCSADLTSRGYREFEEVVILPTDLNVSFTKRIISFDIPVEMRKSLYIRVETADRNITASRISLAHPRRSISYNESYDAYLTAFDGIDHEGVYFMKDGKVYVETREEVEATKVYLGMYKKLARVTATEDDYHTIDIPIREGLEEAYVFYGTYFVLAKYSVRPEDKDAAMKTYKYFVEDINTELNYEDMFYEEEAVIITERI